MEVFRYANLGLRFLLELCALAAVGYWGFSTGKGFLLKVLLGMGIPLLAAVAWGMFVSPKASFPATGWLLLLLELCFFGSAAVALYAVGNQKLAAIYGIVMAINLTLIYVWKQ